jgi:integrase/recombinase XerD
MKPRRERIMEDLQLKGDSHSNQKLYLSAVRQLCEHFNKPPGRITEEDLRDYFLYGKNDKKWSRSTSTMALCGIKLFLDHTIKRPWPTLLFIRPGSNKSLPVVLSRDEVHRTFHSIRLLRYWICLATIYSCGLHLSEGTHLKVENIDSDRGFLTIRQSKGNKDRNVPLPEKTLQLLRQQWLEHKNDTWLFPSVIRGTCNPEKPISKSSVQTAFRKALKDAGIHKKRTA